MRLTEAMKRHRRVGQGRDVTLPDWVVDKLHRSAAARGLTVEQLISALAAGGPQWSCEESEHLRDTACAIQQIADLLPTLGRSDADRIVLALVTALHRRLDHLLEGLPQAVGERDTARAMVLA